MKKVIFFLKKTWNNSFGGEIRDFVSTEWKVIYQWGKRNYNGKCKKSRNFH